MDSPDRSTLIELVQKHQPALVVIDTVAAAFRGMRENDSGDMGSVTAFARLLARRCCWCIIGRRPTTARHAGTAA